MPSIYSTSVPIDIANLDTPGVLEAAFRELLRALDCEPPSHRWHSLKTEVIVFPTHAVLRGSVET